MRAAGTKASLVKVLREETCVTAVPNLPHQNLKTAVVVDEIYAVCRWSFLKDETFGAVARLYRTHLPTDIPNGTDSIHFCHDSYNHLSLKSLEQQHMYDRSRQAKQFEISEHYTVPNQQELFSLSPNKAGLPQLPVWKIVRRGAAWRWLQGRNEERTRYSWYSDRCRCLGINTARGRHESHTT